MIAVVIRISITKSFLWNPLDSNRTASWNIDTSGQNGTIWNIEQLEKSMKVEIIQVTISGYKLDNPRQCLSRWNTVVKLFHPQTKNEMPPTSNRLMQVENMDAQCKKIGADRCMVVYYEQLVLHPKRFQIYILSGKSLPRQILHLSIPVQMVDHYPGVPKPSMGRRCFAPRGTDQQTGRGETLQYSL